MNPYIIKTEKATVRIHTGKRTEEERKEVFERVATEFCKAVEKRNPGYFKRFASASKQ